MPRQPFPDNGLRPSLLDRLTHDPSAPPARVGFDLAAWRAAVLRDLSWLLSTTNLDSVQSLERYPFVRESSVNYGIPAIAGRAASAVEQRETERALRQVILDFEPRILRDSIVVRMLGRDETPTPHALAFEIEGDLVADPVPLHLALRTVIDINSGEAEVAELEKGR